MALVSVVSVIKYNNNTLHVGKCINSSKDKYVIKNIIIVLSLSI